MHFYMHVKLLLSLAVLVVCKPPIVFNLVQHHSRQGQSSLTRRNTPLSLSPYYDLVYSHYLIDLPIGSPNQNVRMGISTLLAGTYIVNELSTARRSNICDPKTLFSTSASSTYQYRSGNISIGIGNNTILGIVDAFDIVKIDPTIVRNVDLQILSGGNNYRSILGLANNSRSLPNQLFDAQIIEINAFSLFLENLTTTGPDASSGRLTFGGVDTGKFDNSLVALPLAKNATRSGAFSVLLKSLTVWDGTGNVTVAKSTDSNLSYTINLDQTGCKFPKAVVQQIVSLWNLTVVSDNIYIIAKAQVNPSAYTTFDFGSTSITIPIQDFLLNTNDTHYQVTISEADFVGPILGPTFFKRAYTVFDYTNNQISVAPVRQGSTVQNSTAIPRGGAVGLMGFVPQSPPGATGQKLSVGAKAGIGVGVGVGVCVMIGILALALLRRSRRKSSDVNRQKESYSPRRDERLQGFPELSGQEVFESPPILGNDKQVERGSELPHTGSNWAHTMEGLLPNEMPSFAQGGVRAFRPPLGRRSSVDPVEMYGTTNVTESRLKTPSEVKGKSFIEMQQTDTPPSHTTTQ